MTKKITLYFLIVFLPSFSFSQHDSLKLKNIPVSITGYVDAYYAYYTDSLGSNYQKFPSVSPRSNQFGLNTAQITASYDGEKVRGMATLHFGDIPGSTWSANYKGLMEAHAGVRIFKKLWIDAGFFRTHFGTEGLLPKENFTSSVSVCTYYEPYYESGVRLNYTPTDRLAINIYVLNAYGVYEDNNDKKSLGMAITYALGENGNIGYTNYIGDDAPKGDTLSRTRILQNLFFNYQIKKLKIQIGGDYGIQQHSAINDPKKSAAMYSGVASLKYELVNRFSIYGRGEVFNDPQGFMSGVILDKKQMYTGYKLWGATFGLEYKPTDNTYIRLEGRQLQMDKDQEIFRWNNTNTAVRYEAMINMGITFQ
ncbi:MAG: hypothetical protein JWP12_3298 [Bacteroidetes bacterium]|nr:hypothetical protein [Bacteroidota bacterium]